MAAQDDARMELSRRVETYYAPVASRLMGWLEQRGRPLVVGIQGPQGSGKSTLAAAVVSAFASAGRRAFSVSIDDFYLTYDEQRALAARHPGNRCLAYRGYPGTHDVSLGAKVVHQLVKLGEGEETRVPAYDKSAHEGRGDRAPEGGWHRVTGPLDLLIVEGWMLGFSPVRDDTLEEELRAPNRYLSAYSAWTETLQTFVMLDVESLDTIVRWRVDSERARRARGETALSDEDARDYIERCLPAYRVYVPPLRDDPPCAEALRVVLGGDRMPAEPVR